MLLDIRHVTRYHYENPIRESLMELRMQPQKSVRQRLISFDLELEPRAQLFSYIDPFGNAVHHFDVPQPHDELTDESWVWGAHGNYVRFDPAERVAHVFSVTPR